LAASTKRRSGAERRATLGKYRKKPGTVGAYLEDHLQPLGA
jgi:hypothetical protein